MRRFLIGTAGNWLIWPGSSRSGGCDVSRWERADTGHRGRWGEDACRRGLRVIDATCPLVTKVHSEAARSAERGDIVVLIGHAGHEEVEGTLGVAPGATVLVQSVEDVAALDLPPGRPVSYVTQTTLSV